MQSTPTTSKPERIAQIAAGVPKRYLGASLNDYRGICPPAEHRNGIYICGPNNVGKTHLACALVGYYGSIGVPSLYLTAAEVVEKMHHQGITDESYMFDVDLIVIDDITALHQSKSEYERVQLATLLDKRFQDDLGTIVTSNKPLAYWQSDEGHGSIWRTCSAMTEIFIKERHDS